MPTINRQRPTTIPNRIPTSKSNHKAPSAWDLTTGLKVLLYGASGTGKTTLWATFPKPILALICSGGNRPGELRSIDTPEYRKTIDARVISSTEEFYHALENAKDFATIVQDHASGLSDLFLKEIMGMDEIPVAKYRAAGKGESWSVVSQQQYGQLAIKCKEAFRAILNMPQNVIIVAQERVFGGKEDGVDPELIRPTVGAALTPSVTGWLNPACDYVVQAYKRPRMTFSKLNINGKEVVTTQRGKGVEYCLRTAPHDVFMTKFRLPRGQVELPECIVDPTYAKIAALIAAK